jgi:hypothetical protein
LLPSSAQCLFLSIQIRHLLVLDGMFVMNGH